MNKTEELMNMLVSALEKSKKKYFIVCQDSRGVQYVDGSKDKEFLGRVLKNLKEVINDQPD